MLSKDERIVVNAIREFATGIELRIVYEDGWSTQRVFDDKKFNHDVAIALQDYFNRRNDDKGRSD